MIYFFMKKILFSFIMIFGLFFAGCSGEFSFEKNEFDNGVQVNGSAKVNSSLGSRDLDEGRRNYEKITTDIEVLQIFADGTQDSIIDADEDTITVVVRLGAGSEPVKFEDLIVKLDTAAGSQTMLHTFNGPTITEYDIKMLINGTQHKEGYLVSGDMVDFSFIPMSDIGEAESATIRLISKNGAVKPVDFTTPSSMVEATTFLYP